MRTFIQQQKGTKGFSLIELMVAVAILASLTSIAVPSYQNLVIRSQVTEALVAAGKVKSELDVFAASVGRFPATAEEREGFEIVPGDNHPTIQRLAVHGVGACNLNAGCSKSRLEVKVWPHVYSNVGGGSNSQFRLEGSMEPGHTAWTCGPRDVQPLRTEWLPATCRHEAG